MGVGPSRGDKASPQGCKCCFTWTGSVRQRRAPGGQDQPGVRDMGGNVSPEVKVRGVVPDPRLWKWRQDFDSDYRPRMRKQQEVRITLKLQPKKLDG